MRATTRVTGDHGAPSESSQTQKAVEYTLPRVRNAHGRQTHGDRKQVRGGRAGGGDGQGVLMGTFFLDVTKLFGIGEDSCTSL